MYENAQVFLTSLNYFAFGRMERREKQMEFRLRREQWVDLKAGDIIVFFKNDAGHSHALTVRAQAVVNYPTFWELFEDFDPQVYNHKSKQDQLKSLREYYAPQDELTHTVLGIKVEPFKPSVEDLLAIHAKLLYQHGPGSEQEKRFVEAYSNEPEFVRLAEIERRIKRVL